MLIEKKNAATLNVADLGRLLANQLQDLDEIQGGSNGLSYLVEGRQLANAVLLLLEQPGTLDADRNLPRHKAKILQIIG